MAGRISGNPSVKQSEPDNPMSAPNSAGQPPGLSSAQILELTVRGCHAAKDSADALLDGLKTGSNESLEAVRKYEEELDRLDHEINNGVTTLIPSISSEVQARELLACLKFIIELERIGDLLLNVVNRFRAVSGRVDSHDLGELVTMTSIVAGMIGNATEAFIKRDVARALVVLGDDAELDRLRNLMIVRHVENPERQPIRESYHLVTISQTLERAGDHAKNLAEETCHLVTGRSVRHVLRAYDRSVEQGFVERLRKTITAKS
ncbi:MAG TPA: phosphate uptake regulator PhoU [Terriglobales bacterium]|nr:phosphate uptake regulator PhoU [Terriglobales bacterium]